jgi:mannose-6-phosphate isomerase-like protein (cupin superfamily)
MPGHRIFTTEFSMERLIPSSALAKLAETAGRQFMEVFSHGTLTVEIYRPVKVDLQEPHTRDEVYVVISGSGRFMNGKARHPFQAGEVLFVPAGVEHRFLDFTDDFSTWVFFYGPEGGEAAGKHHIDGLMP